MKRVGLGVALAACAAVEAAEPAAVVPVQTAQTPAAAPAPASAPAPAVPNPNPALRKPLDLRIGDVRKYMMPNEFRAALDEPDAEKNTVVVEAQRELLPVQYEKPIPVGPLMPLFWGLMHPHRAGGFSCPISIARQTARPMSCRRLSSAGARSV